jgi:hypothetical protein
MAPLFPVDASIHVGPRLARLLPGPLIDALLLRHYRAFSRTRTHGRPMLARVSADDGRALPIIEVLADTRRTDAEDRPVTIIAMIDEWLDVTGEMPPDANRARREALSTESLEWSEA